MWDQLDVDHSGKLEGADLLDLAQFMWHSLHPGKKLNSETRKSWAAKMLQQIGNEDQAVREEDFQTYYQETAQEIQESARALQELQDLCEELEEAFPSVSTMGAYAKAKFLELDQAQSGNLEAKLSP
jgi:hypothetical protein